MDGPEISATESRLSLGAPEGGKVAFDYMNEVISSFNTVLISAGPAGKGVWRLDYDMVWLHMLSWLVSVDIPRQSIALKRRSRADVVRLQLF
jgi:hypothetical protein